MIRSFGMSLLIVAALYSIDTDGTLAAPIGGVTATANTPINFNAAAGAGILTDGVIDDDDWLTEPWVILGWQDAMWLSGADSGVLQPRLTFDLGNTYLVNSVTVHYTVDQIAGDDTRNLRAPDSMTAAFSTTGTGGPFSGSITELGWDDTPGPNDNLGGGGVGHAKSLTTSLGVVVNAVQLDFLTNGEWLFISEISFDGQVVPEPGMLGLLSVAGLMAAGLRRR